MSFPTGYTKYQEVTIDHTKVAADLTDYVVYVNLADLVKAGADIFDTCRTDGGDIRATKSDGTTQLATELVAINTTAKTGELYIKFTGTLSSSTDTIIRIYYNGTDTALAVTDTYGRNEVWSDYAGVWHLSETSGDATDSTGNGSTGTNTGVTYASGKIGNEANFDAAADNIYLGNPSALQITGAHTVSFWMKGSAPAGLVSVIAKGGVDSASDINFSLMKYAGGSMQYWVSNGSSLSAVAVSDANADANFFDNNRHLVEIKYNPSTRMDIFRDGTSYANSTSSIVSSAISTKGMSFGKITTSQSATARDSFIGQMDEVRFYSGLLSADHSQTQYNNQNSPSTFYSAGGEEEASSGVTINPTAQVATLSIPTYTVKTGATIPVNAQAISFSIPAYAITGEALVSVNAQTATFTIPAYTLVAGGLIIPANAKSLTFTIPTYSIIAGTDVGAGISQLTFSIPTPEISGGVNIVVSPVTLTMSIPALAFLGGLWRRSARATASDGWTRSSINNN